MAGTAKTCWRNCLGANLEQADGEILAIDALEDSIDPVSEDARQIRGLIANLESCHQKVQRRIGLIIEAIGSGKTSKGPGKRPQDEKTEIEITWQNCYDVLTAWCTGNTADVAERNIGGISAQELLGYLGERTALKQWQVERLVERIHSDLEPSFQYHRMMCDFGDYGQPGEKPVGEPYRGQEEFLAATKATVIHDTQDGQAAQMPLALAIDFLNPCNWNFLRNLSVVLRAIGGNCSSDTPFACCSRNITLAPIRERMKTVTKTLNAFCNETAANTNGVDADIIATLGTPTPVKCWLASSLQKTIRLQLKL